MRLAEGLDRAPVSYEEYRAWPETTTRVEFVDGQPFVSPGPTGPHGVAAARLTSRLLAVIPTGLEVVGSSWDWVLRTDPLLVRQPDVVVVTAAQAQQPRMTEPPLLAVEILSPDSLERDLVTKRREYADAGLSWYWIVSPAPPQILVLRNRDRAFSEHAVARGAERLAVDEPFSVALSPDELLP